MHMKQLSKPTHNESRTAPGMRSATPGVSLRVNKKFHYKKSKVGVGLCLVIWLGLFPFSAHAAWEKTSSPPAAEAPIDLTLCAEKAHCFYASTSHQVFRSENNVWQPVFNLSAANDSILRLRIFPSSSALWIQTGQSIFKMNPESLLSEKIYTASDPEKQPVSFFMESENFWVGTVSGLWLSKDFGKSWQKRSDLADHQPVSLIAKSDSDFFFSAAGAWLKANENSPQTLLRLFAFEDHSDYSDTAESEAEESVPRSSSFFDYTKTSKNHYLATLQGVFKSADGITWAQLSNSGLRNTAISRILWDEKNSALLAVTKQGAFRFDESGQRWKSQNDGFAKLDVRAILLLPNSENLITANSEGLWLWRESSLKNSADPELALLFNKLIRHEPSARAIHKRVIKYSDTSNAKIKSWHAESRLASLLPSLSLGKDWGTSSNVDLDRAGTSDPDRFIGGPWNKDRGADIDLSWDLGDFIFSTSQTSIDSRAKLMVDLRNDLLSEATRLYYERRRLQAETIQYPAPDEKTHLDRLLRIDEITSLLDALTDGYLSTQIEKIYQQHQELAQLWELKK